MKVTLAKALKEKSRLAGRLKRNFEILSQENSKISGSIRSFDLNFEVNATIYDEQVTGRLEQAFMDDLPHCRELTKQAYGQRGLWMRVKEQTSRLLSPLL